LVIILRMAERIIAVLIGGLSIYLGYKLFFHLPFQHDNEGQLELPGVKIVLSRVGPGVFFATFGTIVLFYSLTSPIKVGENYFEAPVEQTNNAKTNPEVIGSKSFIGISSDNATPQQRSKALTSIQMLNCAQRLLEGEELNRDLQDQFSVAIRESKQALLLSVWDENDWGPVDQMGVTGLANDAPFQLRNMFSATYAECPE